MRFTNRIIFMLGILGWICSMFSAGAVGAVEPDQPMDSLDSQIRDVPERWRLNAAGQLEFLHDPLGNGRHWVRKIHTVLLVDRQPKMCRALDRRHSWFFTEALLIESLPLSAPAPTMFAGEQQRRYSSGVWRSAGPPDSDHPCGRR